MVDGLSVARDSFRRVQHQCASTHPPELEGYQAVASRSTPQTAWNSGLRKLAEAAVPVLCTLPSWPTALQFSRNVGDTFPCIR
jgi:hypothetical protein